MKLFIIISCFSISISNISGYDIMKSIHQKDKPQDLKSILTMESEKEDGRKISSW